MGIGVTKEAQAFIGDGVGVVRTGAGIHDNGGWGSKVIGESF